MLEPQDRRLLLECLRPPDRYELNYAIGTTFTLDLLSLLTCPLAFAMFDWQDTDGRPIGDPLAVLEALRRYSEKMAIFCQAGQITIPSADQPLFTYLEPSVFEAKQPRRGHVFHPKIWMLRFTTTAGPVRYRLLCLSRNLTFDRCWDSALTLDGELVDRRLAIKANHPLADFIAGIPARAVRPLPRQVRQSITRVADEARRIRWDLPDGVESAVFWTLGPDNQSWPFGENRIERFAVISPFLTSGALARLGELGSERILVSRVESLARLPGPALEGFDDILTLNEAADLEARDGDEAPTTDQALLRGLHAKCYVADDGWKAHVWTGSANATEAGFGGNVEFLVQLTGMKSLFGIDALFKRGETVATFRDLLVEYDPADEALVDELGEALLRRADEARYSLAAAKLVATAIPGSDDQTYTLNVTAGKKLDLGAGVTVRCWPSRFGEGRSATLNEIGGASFAGVAVETISSFFAFEVTATERGRSESVRFTLNLPLEGAPTDRRERLLRSILSDKQQVLRFLLFLLADEGLDALDVLVGNRELGTSPTDPLGFGIPVLESMLRALDRDPSRLDHVEHLVTELTALADGTDLLPDGFTKVWEPILAARRGRT